MERWCNGRKLVMCCILLVFTALTGCGGGGGGGGTTDNGVKKATVSGQVSFPALSSLVAKQVADTTVPAGTIIPPVMIISDLDGNEIMRPTLEKDPSDSSGKSFKYSASLDSNKNYVFKASWGGQVLRAIADESELKKLTTDIKVTPVSTAAVLVVEKTLALTPGTLGMNATAEQVQSAATSLATLPATTIATNITTALTACTTSSTTVTDTQAQLASLANIVTAAIVSKVDSAAFVAGTATVTTVTATTYTATGGTVTTTQAATVTPTDASDTVTFITANLPKITSANNATFTAGKSGSFTVTGTGTLSVWGNLPSGVTFEPSTGILGGTPVAASNGTYLITFTASNNGIDAVQQFTLTVNPPVPVFTTAMIADKEFDVSYSGGTFHLKINADGTFWKGTTSGTWTINASGQLVKLINGETDTLTLVSSTSSSFVASYVIVYSDNTTSSGTLTFTVSTGGGGSSTPTPSIAGTYSVTAAGMTASTLIITAGGVITGTDFQGQPITGTANTQTGAFTTSVAIPDKPGYYVNSTGNINLATGAMTGTYASTYPGSTDAGSFTGIRTNTSSNTGSITAGW